MYEVKKTSYGIYLRFDGESTFEERARSFRDALWVLGHLKDDFSVFSDLRGHRVIPNDAQSLIAQGTSIYREINLKNYT